MTFEIACCDLPNFAIPSLLQSKKGAGAVGLAGAVQQLFVLVPTKCHQKCLWVSSSLCKAVSAHCG